MKRIYKGNIENKIYKEGYKDAQKEILDKIDKLKNDKMHWTFNKALEELKKSLEVKE